MKDQAASTVSDEDFAKRAERWPKDTPDTKEAYFIRDIFDCKSTLVFSNSDYQNLISDLLSIQPNSPPKPLPTPPSGGFQEATGAALPTPVVVPSAFILLLTKPSHNHPFFSFLQ